MSHYFSLQIKAFLFHPIGPLLLRQSALHKLTSANSSHAAMDDSVPDNLMLMSIPGHLDRA
jgi:hypothetical protein